MKYKVTKADKSLTGTVELEGSKSITNRVLIVKALCNEYFDLQRFSQSEDSLTLIELLNSSEKILYAKDGGTTFRFLLPFLAIHEGEVILTGSERLIDRPTGPLVEALNSLGAKIQYLGKPGFPPVLINGTTLKGNKVDIDVSMSSQFLSGLLLIAPYLQNGLIIRLKGRVVSAPYIQLTLDIMKFFGITYDWTQNLITISHQEYSARDYRVEGDWSAASYYYQMAALSDEVDLKIMNLNRISSQGDSVISKIMDAFGVKTTYIENGIHLTKTDRKPHTFDYDFTACPDLAQTIIATCAALEIPSTYTGISTLQYKETNRMSAMANELAKIDITLSPKEEVWKLSPEKNKTGKKSPVFDTYNDHRMALSLAPLAIVNKSVIIEDPFVVRKSYPTFWNNIQKLGFKVEEIS